MSKELAHLNFVRKAKIEKISKIYPIKKPATFCGNGFQNLIKQLFMLIRLSWRTWHFFQ